MGPTTGRSLASQLLALLMSKLILTEPACLHPVLPSLPHCLHRSARLAGNRCTLHGPQNLLPLTTIPGFSHLPSKRHACYEGRRWVARDRAAHAAFLGVRWLSTDVVEAGGPGAWRGEVLPRRSEGCAGLRRARSLPGRRLLPRRGQRGRRAAHRRPRTASSMRGRWTARPTSSGSPGSTSTPVARRVGSATTRTRCGSSRSPSTDPRPGRWPRRCIRRSRPRWTRPRTRPPPRSSAGSPSTRPPGSGRAGGRCRCRSSRSRPR